VQKRIYLAQNCEGKIARLKGPMNLSALAVDGNILLSASQVPKPGGYMAPWAAPNRIFRGVSSGIAPSPPSSMRHLTQAVELSQMENPSQ
jgi:hypothetical protein